MGTQGVGAWISMQQAAPKTIMFYQRQARLTSSLGSVPFDPWPTTKILGLPYRRLVWSQLSPHSSKFAMWTSLFISTTHKPEWVRKGGIEEGGMEWGSGKGRFWSGSFLNCQADVTGLKQLVSLYERWHCHHQPMLDQSVYNIIAFGMMRNYASWMFCVFFLSLGQNQILLDQHIFCWGRGMMGVVVLLKGKKNLLKVVCSSTIVCLK